MRQAYLLTMPYTPYFILPESVGRYKNFPDHDVSRNVGALNNFNIHYVAAGKGYVEMDGTIHELRRGQAVLYFPMQAQRYYSSKDDPWDVRWVHFYGSRLQEYMVERGLHEHRLWSLRQPEAWEEAHLALLAEAEQYNMLRPARLSTLTYAVVAEFIQQAIPLKEVQGGRSASRIEALLPLMQQEARQPFELRVWAERAGISPHYFCKLFRNITGMTPVEFITRARLQYAKQRLLEHVEMNIGDIASESGYPNASYFNKRFIEHEGMTPTEYRRLYMGGG